MDRGIRGYGFFFLGVRHIKTVCPQTDDGKPRRLKSISQAKHKSDQLDAITLCNLIRSDFFPACYVSPPEVRSLRNLLRYRTILVREQVRFKNKTACLLMSAGVRYNKRRLHGKKYFQSLIEREELPEELKELLRLKRLPIEFFRLQARLVLRRLEKHPDIEKRLELLKTIPGVGSITALTWILEIWDPYRFPNNKHAHSYCGLCGGRKESGERKKGRPFQNNVTPISNG